MTQTFTRRLWDGNRYSAAYRNCGTECALCGRPINFDRATIIRPQWLDGAQFTLVPVAEWKIETENETGVGGDPADWVGPDATVGSHCAKKFPKGFKMTVKRAYALYQKNHGC